MSRSEVFKARSLLANEVRRVRAAGDDAAAHPEVLSARRALAAAKIEAYVARVLAQAPPLQPDQRAKIIKCLQEAQGQSAPPTPVSRRRSRVES